MTGEGIVRNTERGWNTTVHHTIFKSFKMLLLNKSSYSSMKFSIWYLRSTYSYVFNTEQGYCTVWTDVSRYYFCTLIRNSLSGLIKIFPYFRISVFSYFRISSHNNNMRYNGIIQNGCPKIFTIWQISENDFCPRRPRMRKNDLDIKRCLRNLQQG